MEIKAAVAPVAGRFTWRASTKTAGAKQLVAVLRGDDFQGNLEVGAALSPGGHTPGTAYVSGTRGFLYCPAAGEDINALVGSVAGTADDVAIGDLFGINNDGKLKANSSYASRRLTTLEGPPLWPSQAHRTTL
jgi:hypothetical protein